MKEVLENLSSENVKTIKFYYKNSRLIGNICTVCLLIGENNELLSRGISICSLRDSHNKTTGKNIALGRAIKALKKKDTSEEITHRSKLIENSCVRTINNKNKYIKDIEKEVSDNEFKIKTIKQGTEVFYKIIIPLDYSVDQTSKLFTFKSEYKPKITVEEKCIIGKKLLN